jgi:ATP-binding cassette subfamily F protein 3
VAHDRYLLNEVAEEVWSLDENGLTQHVGGFEEFHARQKQEEAARNGASGADPEEVQERRKLTREEKRRQAEERNRLYRELKPLKKKYDKLEADLEKVLDEQAGLEKRMNDPATYEKPEQALKLNAAYKDATEWAETLMEQMAELESRMEAIGGEQGAA